MSAANLAETSAGLLEGISSGSFAPAEALTLLRRADLWDANAGFADRLYAAFRGFVFGRVVEREAGNDLDVWADLVLRVRQLLRLRNSPIAERFTVLADFLEQTVRVAELHAPDRMLARKHVREVLATLRSAPELPRARVAETTGLKEANLSRLLSNLAAVGWVRRRMDGREAHVGLTAEGAKAARLSASRDASGDRPLRFGEEVAALLRPLNEAGCGVAISDGSGVLVRCNDTFASLFGQSSPEKLVGLTVGPLFANSESEGRLTGNAASREFETATGAVVRVVECRGENSGVWLTFDVSQYRLESRDYQRRLRLLHDRFAERSPQNSRRGVRNAPNPTRDIGSWFMLPRVRDDLFTPIHSISGLTRLLQAKAGRALGEAEKQWITGIQSNSEHLRQVVQDLVCFVEIAEVPREESIPIEPERMVAGIVDRLRYTTTRANLSVSRGHTLKGKVETNESALRATAMTAALGMLDITNSGGRVDFSTDLDATGLKLTIATNDASPEVADDSWSRALRICGVAAKNFGGNFEFVSRSGSGTAAATLSWPIREVL